MRKSLFISFAIAFTCFAFQIKAQNNDDGLLISEARTAMEKYNDCKSAIKILNKVSSNGQGEELYLYYSAKAYECSGDKTNALLYYKKYAAKTSMTADLMDKIADLSYQENRKSEEQQNLLKRNNEAQQSLLRKVAQCTGYTDCSCYNGNDFTKSFPFSYSESDNKMTISYSENLGCTSFSKFEGIISEKKVGNLSYTAKGKGTFIAYTSYENVYNELQPQNFEFEFQVDFMGKSYFAELRIKRASYNFLISSGPKKKDFSQVTNDGGLTTIAVILN